MIAQLEFNSQCEVLHALPGVRQYAMPVDKAQKVRGISLEGEKNIDKTNAKVLLLSHGRWLSRVDKPVLARRHFSSLYYTESASITPHSNHPAMPEIKLEQPTS